MLMDIQAELHTLQDKIQLALKLAEQSQATAEVGAYQDQGLSVSVRQGEVDKVEFTRNHGFGITVYRGNSKGSASTSDFSDAAIERAVQAALDIAHYTAPDECAGLAEPEHMAQQILDLDLYHPWDLTPQKAITMAQAGGAGVIHRNLTHSSQALEVEKVKKSESGMIVDPVTLGPEKSVAEALELLKKYCISGLPIVDGGSKLIGLVTNRDLRFEENLERNIKEIMTPMEKLVIAQQNITMEEAKRLMHKHRIEKLPVVDSDQSLRGLITIKDIEKSISHPLANRDLKGRLRVGAAVGTAADTLQRVESLVAVGVDFITVDTAHGDSRNVVDVVQKVKSKYKDLPVIAGNVATSEGATHLFEAGADAIKVGMGCGSICTTRIIAGIGSPQLTAIYNCAKRAADASREGRARRFSG